LKIVGCSNHIIGFHHTWRGGLQAMVCMNAAALPRFQAGTSLESIEDLDSRFVLAAFLAEAGHVFAEYCGTSKRNEMSSLRTYFTN
jgi:hypothetical protein